MKNIFKIILFLSSYYCHGIVSIQPFMLYSSTQASFNKQFTQAIGQIQAPKEVCYGQQVSVKVTGIVATAIINWEISDDNQKTWREITSLSDAQDKNTLVFNALSTSWVRQRVQMEHESDLFYSEVAVIEVFKNEFVSQPANNFNVELGSLFTIPTIQTTLDSDIKIYDQDNNEVKSGQSIKFDQQGVKNYTVLAQTKQGAACLIMTSFSVKTYNLAQCDILNEKVFATIQKTQSSLLSNVEDEKNANDKDLSTHSTLKVVLGLLGLGHSSQSITFDHTVEKGTPLIIKLGKEFSTVELLGSIKAQAIDGKNKNIGPKIAVGEGALLGLLGGENVFEFSFIPQDDKGNIIDYKGVQITLSATLSVGTSAKIYGVYYDKQISTVNKPCLTKGKVVKGASGTNGPLELNPLVDDVLWGVESGALAVASSLSPVVNPYFAVDNNLDSYTVFNKAVAVLNRQVLTVKFNQSTRAGDQIRILMGGFSLPILDLSLLTDFRIQRYMGNVKVGEPVLGSQFKVLNLNLLGITGQVGNRMALLVDAIDQPFDQVELSYFSTVQVGLLGDYTYVYDITVVPNIYFDEDVYQRKTKLCAGLPLEIQRLDMCTDYQVSLAYGFINQHGVMQYNDISESELLTQSSSDNSVLLGFSRLFTDFKDNLYLKVQVHRQKCPYGPPQYFEIDLVNCIEAFANPSLKIRTLH